MFVGSGNKKKGGSSTEEELLETVRYVHDTLGVGRGETNYVCFTGATFTRQQQQQPPLFS